jgi:TatD DNase family protein
MLIDSHAHLEMSDYDPDREDVIKRARDQGIENIITIGIGPEECEQALALARTYPFIYAALGLHPHNARNESSRLFDFIKKGVRDDKVVALGEMGLDFYKNWSPRQDQIRCFHEQLALARALKRGDTLLFRGLPYGRAMHGHGFLYFYTGNRNI